MFGRQIFLKPVDNQHDERRNDYIRQLSPSQGHGIPFTELISVPYLRNDGLMLDLNFIFIDDDHVQSNNLNNLYFQTLVLYIYIYTHIYIKQEIWSTKLNELFIQGNI